MKLLTRTGIIAIAVLALAAAAGAPAAAQELPRISVLVPKDEPDKGDTFDVQIVAENVVGLGAFQFALRFDNDILTATAVARTDFLAAGGSRDVVCNDAEISGPTVSLLCVTAGGAELPGAEGSGPIATVTFEAIASGDSPLELTAQLSRVDGVSLPSTSAGGEISIADPRDWTPIIIIAGVAAAILVVAIAGAALLLRRRRRASAADWSPPTESPVINDDPGV